MGLLNYEVMLNNRLLTDVNGLSILSIDPYAPPTRTLGSWILSRADKRKINSSFTTERHIAIQCAISQNSRNLLDAAWDNVMSLIQVVEKTLIIPWGDSPRKRQFTVSLNGYNVDEKGGGYIKFTLDYVCSDNFGYDPALTQLIAVSSRTLYNYTDNFQVQGSAPWQAPVIKITLSAVTAATGATITLKNPATGVAVAVTRTWLAGDLLTVDCQNKSVQVNGADVDFTGGIPEWQTGIPPNFTQLGYLNYQDNFGTRTMSNFTYYFRRWS